MDTSKTVSLTLRCACGATRRFSGEDVDAIIEAVDASGWRDRLRPDTDVCPACQAAEEEDEAGWYDPE